MQVRFFLDKVKINSTFGSLQNKYIMIKDTPLTFPDLLKSSVSRFAERPAYAFVGEKALTYKEVSDTSKAVTFMLEQLGIVPGDKVGLFSSKYAKTGVLHSLQLLRWGQL